MIGVDEHVWRHTRRGDKYVTVIIDLTPVRDGTGPARLLDMVEGRSKQAFQQWLADRPQDWRDRVEVVAMDGFSGFKTATAEELPDAVDGDGSLPCGPAGRQRPRLNAGAGSSWPPAGTGAARPTRSMRARRTLQTGADLLTDKQRARLAALFAVDAHAEVEATWTMYQRTVAAYRHPDRKTGRTMMAALITTLSTGVPKALQEVITLGRTLKKRAADVLAYFDRPGTSPTGRPKRSTAVSNTSEDPPWDSVTSPTTSPDRYWKPADSDPNYTLHS